MTKLKIIAVASLTGILILSFLFIVTLWSKSSGNQNKSNNLRHHPNEAFGYGERLDYKVGYKFITAGTGYFHILPDPVYKHGRKCYDVRFQVQSLKSLEWIYRVKDQYRTMLDVSGIFPWEFEQKIREGNYKRDEKAEFDQFNNIAYNDGKTYKVIPYVHDIVSAFYFVRTLNISSMRKDTVFYVNNFYKDTVYNLGVKVLGKQVVEVEAGKFRCVVLEPMVVEGGLFKSEGKILVWVTDDERKIPVKVSTKILIGYVSAELTSYRGLRGPLAAKLN